MNLEELEAQVTRVEDIHEIEIWRGFTAFILILAE